MSITQNPIPVTEGNSVTLNESTSFMPVIVGATVETFTKTGTDLGASNWKGSTTQIDGIIGKGASFNGTTDYITADSFPTLTTQGTISAWVQIYSDDYIVLLQQGQILSQSLFPLLLRAWPNGIYLDLSDGINNRQLLTSNKLRHGWNHIVVRFDLSVNEFRFYTNGEIVTYEVSIDNGSPSELSGDSLTDKYIGKYINNSIDQFGKGSISNLSITSDLLTDTQILQLATLPSILDERRDIYLPEDYEFLETFTKTGTDAPATIIDGTYTGSGWTSLTQQRSFPIGNSAYNNEVRRYNPNSWLLNRDYSICCWFKCSRQWNPTYQSALPLWATNSGASGSAGSILCFLSHYIDVVVDYKTITFISFRDSEYANATTKTFRIPDSVNITGWHSLVYTGDDVTVENGSSNVYLDGILLTVTQVLNNGINIGIGTQAKNISFGSTDVSVALAALYYRKLNNSEVLAWSNKIYEKQIGNGTYTPYRPIGALVETFSRTGTDAPEANWNYSIAGGLQKKYGTMHSSESSLVKRDDMGLLARNSLVNNDTLTYAFWIKYHTNSQSSESALCYDTFLLASDGSGRFYSGFNRNTNVYSIIGCNSGGGPLNGTSYDISNLLPADITQWIHIGVCLTSASGLYASSELYINGVKATNIISIPFTCQPDYSDITTLRMGGFPLISSVESGACEIAEYIMMDGSSYSFEYTDFVKMARTPPSNNKLLTNASNFSYLVPSATLLRLKEAEVSMLCIDGTDGKGNAFQLHPIFSAYNIKDITWISSDITKATVSSNGLVIGVGVGDVTITCTCNGISKSCLFTVFATLPNDTTLYTLKGGNGGNTTGVWNYTVAFSSITNKATYTALYGRVVAKTYAGADHTYLGGIAAWDGGGMSFNLHEVGNGGFSAIKYYSHTNGTSNLYNHIRLGTYAEAGSKLTLDYSNSITGLTYNGDIVSPQSETSDYDVPVTQTGLAFYFSNLLEKMALVSFSSIDVTHEQLGIKDNCELFYIPQNYVRYSDHDGITNPTKILNMGTSGNKYDLSADNVPSTWYENITPIAPELLTIEVTVEDGQEITINNMVGANKQIIWGDGNTTTESNTSFNHTYASAGVYTIYLEGNYTAANYTPLCTAISKVVLWKNVIDAAYMFYGCASLTTIPSTWTGLTNVTNTGFMFANCASLTVIPNSWTGLTNVTNTSGMFYGCPLSNIPSTWTGLENVTNALEMFNGCPLSNIPNSWTGLTNVTNTSGMFYNCTSLTVIPSTFEGLENVTITSYMFYNCALLTAIPDSWTGLTNVTNTSAMFYNCASLTVIPNSWTGLTNVTNTAGMFYNCASLTTISSTFEGLENVTDTSAMFYNCALLTAIPDSWVGLTNVTNTTYMFYNCALLTNIPSTWTGLTNVTNMSNIFYNCSSLTDIPSWEGLENVTDVYGMFFGCTLLTTIPNSWAGLSNVTNMSYMFYECTSLASDIYAMYQYLSTKTQSVTEYLDTFYNCTLATGYSSVPISWGGSAPD